MVTVDIAVVGAGPAGLAAAAAAVGRGRTVALIDAAAQPGGQFWRHPPERLGRPDGGGHHLWSRFTALRSELSAASERGALIRLPATQVWFIERGATATGRWTVHLTASAGGRRAEHPEAVKARALILCPGGYDRQLPIPGWDLPGVMGAGGVQALLKGSGTLAGRRAVVGGTGPFLLPVARHLADAGATVVAICEANAVSAWARHLPAVLRNPSKIAEGAGYATALTRHRVPYRTRTVVTGIDADTSGSAVGAVRFGHVDGTGNVLAPAGHAEVDLVALGWGFTPSLELVTAIGADTCIDVDRSLVAVVDALQRSSVRGAYVAGEATGVGGALLALDEGELAGIAAAGAALAEPSQVRRLQRAIRRRRAFATAIHRAHPVPPSWQRWLDADTIVCRCEEVGLPVLTRARADLGADDARSLKLTTRAGMGWCQGRICGYAVADLAAADEDGPSADDLRAFAKRPLCAPVSLAELAREADG
jgi:NADP-dependent aldehyde dehydrogenase